MNICRLCIPSILLVESRSLIFCQVVEKNRTLPLFKRVSEMDALVNEIGMTLLFSQHFSQITLNLADILPTEIPEA